MFSRRKYFIYIQPTSAHKKPRFWRQITAVTLMMASFVFCATAEDAHDGETIYLDETYISGNQELPKVLYILPWQRQSGGVISAARPRSSLDRVMTPVYPQEYRLELAFRAQFSKAKRELTHFRPNDVQESENDSSANTRANTSNP